MNHLVIMILGNYAIPVTTTNNLVDIDGVWQEWGNRVILDSIWLTIYIIAVQNND